MYCCKMDLHLADPVGSLWGVESFYSFHNHTQLHCCALNHRSIPPHHHQCIHECTHCCEDVTGISVDEA